MITTLFVADTFMDNSVDIMTSYLATSNFINVQKQAIKQRLSRHTSLGALKICCFYAIMITYYLTSQLISWKTREGLNILMLAYYPSLPWLQRITHWTTMIITVTTLVVLEAVKVYATHRMDKDNPANRKHTTQPQSIQPPLPRKDMVLVGVMLWQSFIGWPEKLGHRYWGFIDSINQTLMNTTHCLQVINKQSIATTKQRVNHSFLVVMMIYMLLFALAFAAHHISPSI